MTDAYTQVRAASQPAALLAAAACARVHRFQAVRIRIGEHWSPDRPEHLLVPDQREPRPAFLLPIAQFAFQRLYDVYDKKDGMLLFSSSEKEPETEEEFDDRSRVLRTALSRIGDRMGTINTGKIMTRMHDFFDLAIPPGTSDKMIFALSGPKSFKASLPAPTYDVPFDKLRRFLEVHHPLRGPAGAYTGTRGRNWIASQKRNFPESTRARVFDISAAYEADPIVLGLRGEGWPEDEEKWDDFRLEMKDKYFPHIHGLRISGELTRREELALFKASAEMVRSWGRERVVPDPIERPRSEAKKMFIDAFADRKPGETPYALWLRTARSERCNVRHSVVDHWWRAAGLFKRRPGRPRKLHTLRPRRNSK
jgi:hypothetical protein